MKRVVILLALGSAIVAGLLASLPAEAGGNIEALSNGNANIINAFWDPRTYPIRYRLNQNLALGLDSATVRPEIDAAFAAWEDLADNSLDLAWGGTTTANSASANGLNVLIFSPPSDPGNFAAAAPCTTLTAEQVVTDSSDGNPSDGLGWLRAGATNVLRVPVGAYSRGTNIDCDIIFNVFDVSFTVTGAPPTQDIRAVATHEIGHWLSLSHSFDPDSTIFPFVDTNPIGDGAGGPTTVETEDAASAGKFYKEAGYDATRGAITGSVSIDGFLGDGVQVHAVRASDLEVVAGRFSISRFMDTLDVFDGPDFLANGGGFYRLDGLPPGDYYVYAEWLDSTDEPFGRLDARYNYTSGNSTVADGNSANYNGALGYRPERFEFYNTLESGDGGDGVTPGSTGDNPDEALKITLAAGDVVPGVNIDINLDPDTGKSDAARSNPTGIGRHDVAPLANLVGGQLLPEEGNEDNYWIVRVPASDLPAPPYNVLEGIWTKNGRSDKSYTGGMLMAHPNNPMSVQPFIVFDSKRLVAGGPNGGTGTTEQVDVRDRFNVTVNEARDLFFAVRQPESGPGITYVSEGYFVLTRDAGASCSSNGAACSSDADCNGPGNTCVGNASGNTLLTFDGFTTFSGFLIDDTDLIYRVRTETAPPVMLTGSSSPSLSQGFSGTVSILGSGYKPGAEVRLLRPTYDGSMEPTDVSVMGVTYISSGELQIDVSAQGNAVPGILDVEVRNPEVVIPNRSRLLSLVAGADGDGDGWADAGDCAAGNIDLWSLPGPVGASVSATIPGPGSAQFGWSPPADAGGNLPATYDVVQGTMAALIGSGGTDFGSCQATGQAAASFTDADTLAPGEVRMYMVASRNGCGSSSYVTPDGSVSRDANPGNC